MREVRSASFHCEREALEEETEVKKLKLKYSFLTEAKNLETGTQATGSSKRECP